MRKAMSDFWTILKGKDLPEWWESNPVEWDDIVNFDLNNPRFKGWRWKLKDFRDNLRRAKYWFLYRFSPKHKRHIIQTELSPDWYDSDILMKYALKSLLVNFFEREEMAFGDCQQSPEGMELIQLYWWFKSIDLDMVKEEDLTPKLVRLVELRNYLWT